MPPSSNALALRFERLSVFQQTTLMVLAALVGTELLVVVFYSIFFEDRLLLDMVLSGIIVLAVGYPLGAFFISQNVRLRLMAVKLDRAARIDDLTGLANRRTYFSDAEAALATAEAGRGAFLFIDLDRFKQINDSLGHGVGDRVLRDVGDAIARCVRDGDIAARLGGEEFGVYLPRADGSIAFDVAERIRARIARVGRQAALRGLRVTASIGVALRQEGECLDALMARADRNLYAAKDSGRDRIVGCVERAA